MSSTMPKSMKVKDGSIGKHSLIPRPSVHAETSFPNENVDK